VFIHYFYILVYTPNFLKEGLNKMMKSANGNKFENNDMMGKLKVT